MVATLDDFRRSYPRYRDVPDEDLADAIYEKYYVGRIERPKFDKKLGLTKDSDPSWPEVASGILSNFGSSAVGVVEDTITPFAQPVETAKALGGLVVGGVQKLVPGEQSNEKYADALGAFLKDRYGSVGAFKQTLRDDPAGVMADASMFLTGGTSALARAPGIAGKVGEAAKVASAVDPANVTFKAGGAVAKSVPELVGVATGTGSAPLKIAFKSGREGGEAGRAFRENLRDGSTEQMLEAVDDANAAVRQLYAKRGAQYVEDMSGIGNVGAVVRPGVFQQIGRAAGKALNMHTFKGVDFSPKTRPVRQEVFDTVSKWKDRDPNVFHTADGLDKMKREIGDIRDAQTFGSPSWKAANDVYRAVDTEITKVFPEYAAAMQNYARTTKQIKDLQRTLSVGSNATPDQTLRKLQSSMHDNVSTNYGARQSMVEELEMAAPNLTKKIAGQSLSSFVPRGLSKYVGLSQIGGAGAAALANPLTLLPLSITLPASSPRLMGEAFHGVGRAVRGLDKARVPVDRAASIMVSAPAAQASRAAGMLTDELGLLMEEEEYR